MICNIKWNVLNLGDWNHRFQKIPRTTVLQSYEYARAICKHKKIAARWGLIDIDGVEAGLAQVLEASFLNRAFHVLMLDRGPLWFESFGSDQHLNAFLEAYLKEFPKRPGRKHRFIPEVEDTEAHRQILTRAGFKRNPRITPYETLWLDLRQDEETLRAGLKKNWRGTLKTAEKILKDGRLEIEWDTQGRFLTWLLLHYKLDKAVRSYGGASAALLKHIAKSFIPSDNFLIGCALINRQPIAAILLLCHGSGATYQIGYTSDEGRALSAHHLLLWNAITKLKERGIYDFDLGGIPDDEGAGLRTFKTGMGGSLIRLPGLYS